MDDDDLRFTTAINMGLQAFYGGLGLFIVGIASVLWNSMLGVVFVALSCICIVIEFMFMQRVAEHAAATDRVLVNKVRIAKALWYAAIAFGAMALLSLF